MDFLSNLFGMGGSNDCCNKNLKKHLRECAGLGQLPPLEKACGQVNQCQVEQCGCNGGAKPKKDPCEVDPMSSLAGPPIGKGCTEAPSVCCNAGVKKIKVFCPQVDVPPTLQFCCPEDSCARDKCAPQVDRKNPCGCGPSNGRSAGPAKIKTTYECTTCGGKKC